MGAGGGGGDTLPLGGMHRILEKKRSGVSLDALSYVQEEKCHAHLCNNLDTNSCNKVYLQCYVLHNSLESLHFGKTKWMCKQCIPGIPPTFHIRLVHVCHTMTIMIYN